MSLRSNIRSSHESRDLHKYLMVRTSHTHTHLRVEAKNNVHRFPCISHYLIHSIQNHKSNIVYIIIIAYIFGALILDSSCTTTGWGRTIATGIMKVYYQRFTFVWVNFQGGVDVINFA